MKRIKSILFFAVTLVVLPQPVWAVIPKVGSGVASVPLTNPSGAIERGGTITEINFDKKSIAVDGIDYPLATSIKIYAADNMEVSLHKLRKGMRIRFTTIKDAMTGREKTTEIWITISASRPARK